MSNNYRAPRKNRSRNPLGRATALLRTETDQTDALRQIWRLTEAQYLGVLPTVQDPIMTKLKPQKVYTFERAYQGPLLNASTTVDQAGGYQFTLSSFPGATEFTSLFDVYRIQMIQIDIIPLNPTVTAGTLYTVIDYDDASMPTALADLLQYDTLQISSSNTITKRTFQPRVALAAYGGATFTAYAQGDPSQWIDVASPGVPYYGFKYYLPAYSATTPTSNAYQVNVKAVLQFKHAR